MEKDRETKLGKLLENMSNYSSQQPKEIEILCKELYISPAYAPAIDLMVEAFLTVYSFSLLMSNGLVSNASAILRILIEQVAAVTVISLNPKAMNEFLIFQTKKRKYYGSDGKEHEKIRDILFQEAGYKKKNEKTLKDYLDYGWIRVLGDDKGERGKNLIIKKAHLEEVIVDIDEQLNAFAHGQRSIFELLKHKDLADRHVSRIIMVAGKMFLFLCNAKHELLVNESVTADKYFKYYLNVKILYFDLNARATNSRIVDIIKTTDNLKRDTIYSMSTIDHMRGLMYQSELDYSQVNIVARAYVIDLISFMFMVCYKLFATKEDFLEGVDTFSDLISKVSLDNIEPYYNSFEHYIPLSKLIEMVNMNDDNWVLMKSSGRMSDLDEIFITDFTSLAHSLFENAYPGIDADELVKSFVPID